MKEKSQSSTVMLFASRQDEAVVAVVLEGDVPDGDVVPDLRRTGPPIPNWQHLLGGLDVRVERAGVAD